jgi:hypothetical protein
MTGGPKDKALWDDFFAEPGIDLPERDQPPMQEQKIYLDDAQWKAFQEALDNPPKENSGLKKLFEHKPSWEK